VIDYLDRQVDLVQEGFDCVLRLGPIRDELIARPLGRCCAWSTLPVTPTWRAMASLGARKMRDYSHWLGRVRTDSCDFR